MQSSTNYMSSLAKLTSVSALMISTALFASKVNANELDLRLSNDAVHAGYTLDSSNSKGKFSLGYFYKDAADSVNVVDINLHAKGRTALANLPTTIGIGFESNLFKLDDFKGTSIGIGGTVRVNIPSAPGVSIESALHYSPDVLSFGDANEFKRFRMQANYRIIENADIGFGYRYINIGIDDTDTNRTIESGLFLGLQLEL